ncbi:MAG: hypothetical protein NC340_04595 [Ruminococcus flavefaciens]|nr:hypothetical protein [Ruminococcus flavefaciens]MCM1229057.1 hypothetical protein [Ruminococcus flavefaciens]
MPAYFDITIQFVRSDIYSTFVRDFYAHLDKCGLNFKSGVECGEEYSCDDIADINQKKLDENFELGFTQHRSFDYRQIYYSFGGYSEVRGFWLNNYPEKNEFAYEIIIPEDELVIYRGKESIFCREKTDGITELAVKIWEFPYVRAIQTELEESDCSVSISRLESGVCPNCLPFAVTEKNNIRENPFRTEKLDRGYIFYNSGTIQHMYEVIGNTDKKA